MSTLTSGTRYKQTKDKNIAVSSVEPSDKLHSPLKILYFDRNDTCFTILNCVAEVFVVVVFSFE